MGRYELTFEVDDLEDDVIDAIYDRFDALVVVHADVTLLTVTAEGLTAVAAGERAVETLEGDLRVVTRRSVEDLVTPTDIADRCGTTLQTVGQWIRGTQHRHSFPARYSLVSGGIWLWGDVNDWLRRVGKAHDDDLRFPHREDHNKLNLWLTGGGKAQHVLHITAKLRYSNDCRTRRTRNGGVFNRPQRWGAVRFERIDSEARSA